MENVYTMDDWNRDRELNVKIGQYISDEVFYQLLECVPPQTYTSRIFQVGEPYDMDEEWHNLYTTFKYDGRGWKYVGHQRAY